MVAVVAFLGLGVSLFVQSGDKNAAWRAMFKWSGWQWVWCHVLGRKDPFPNEERSEE
jgi:hypothetical protein